jgi:type IV pilus assembly protein PilC
MPTFAYEVIDAAGRPLKGRTEAESEETLLQQLQSRRYSVTKVRRVGGAGSGDLLARFKKVDLQALVVFSRQLSTMINAGVAISRCLDILAGQAKDPILQPAIVSARQDLLAGSTLTEAFSRHPRCFSPLYLSMVRAAEVGGILDATLNRLALLLENEYEIRHKVKSAMMYPMVILVFSLLLTSCLMIFILPKFAEIFTSMKVDLPMPTQILFFISNMMQSYWYVLLMIPPVLIFAVRKYEATTRGRRVMDHLKLKMPLVGPLMLKMAVSRFSRTFGTLTNSGVPMMRALEIVEESAGNVILAGAIASARNSVREGQKISTPLEASGWFPSMVCQMIDIGEETGRLSDMLNKISDFYDTEVDAAIKGLTSLIEPIMIVGLGILVGFIAISLMSPIFALQHALATGTTKH